MSVLGFTIRWGSMAFGVLLIVGGVQTLINYKPRNEAARPVTTPEALALASATSDDYVTLDAALDPSTRVYDSYVLTPRYISTDTNLVHPFRAGKAGSAHPLIGATIEVSDNLDSARIECQIVLEDSSGQTLQSMRVLAPVAGAAGMAWVVSPRLESEAEADAWQARGSYQGALSSFENLSTNVSELGYTATQVRDYARNELGLDIPADATLIIDGQGRQSGDGPSFWCAAVEGTNRTLIVRQASEWTTAGSFTGLVDASSSDHELAGAMGFDPDAAVVIDTSRSAASENARDMTAMQVGLIGGPLCFAFGAGTTWLKRAMKRRSRERAFAAAAALSPSHAMALGIPMPGLRSGHVPNPYQPSPPPAPYAMPTRNTPSMRPQPAMGQPRAGGEDSALEAEMSRWTNGSAPRTGQSDRRAA